MDRDIKKVNILVDGAQHRVPLWRAGKCEFDLTRYHNDRKNLMKWLGNFTDVRNIRIGKQNIAQDIKRVVGSFLCPPNIQYEKKYMLSVFSQHEITYMDCFICNLRYTYFYIKKTDKSSAKQFEDYIRHCYKGSPALNIY